MGLGRCRRAESTIINIPRTPRTPLRRRRLIRICASFFGRLARLTEKINISSVVKWGYGPLGTRLPSPTRLDRKNKRGRFGRPPIFNGRLWILSLVYLHISSSLFSRILDHLTRTYASPFIFAKERTRNKIPFFPFIGNSQSA